MTDETNGKGREPEPFERGRRLEVDPRLGELHEARNRATGTPALTLVPRGDVEWQPGGPCRMSLTYEPERESVTVDVEQAPASVRTSDLTNLAVLVTAAFKRVEDDAVVEAHLASGPVRPARARSARERCTRLSWRGLTAAGAAVLAVGLGVWLDSTREHTPSASVDAVVRAENPSQEEPAFITRKESDSAVVSIPMPDKPYAKQALAPCDIPAGEVEIIKGCWMALDKRPPCASKQVEYQGKCYLPVRKEDPVPRSIEP